MFQNNKKWLMLIGTLLVVIVLVGCGAATSTEVADDSGVIDESYTGVTNPVVPKDFKLTEEEKKNGVQKITIKGGVQIDMPNGHTDEIVDDQTTETETNDESAEDTGGEERARPKI